MDEREAKLKAAVEHSAPSLLPFLEELFEARQEKEVHAVVFYGNQNELVHSESLFADKGEAEKARDMWNADIPACETRVATVVTWAVR